MFGWTYYTEQRQHSSLQTSMMTHLASPAVKEIHRSVYKKGHISLTCKFSMQNYTWKLTVFHAHDVKLTGNELLYIQTAE